MIVEVLAGALSGGSCSRPGTKVVANNMLTIVIDPARLRARGEFDQDIADFTAWVKSAATVAAGRRDPHARRARASVPVEAARATGSRSTRRPGARSRKRPGA